MRAVIVASIALIAAGCQHPSLTTTSRLVSPVKPRPEPAVLVAASIAEKDRFVFPFLGGPWVEQLLPNQEHRSPNGQFRLLPDFHKRELTLKRENKPVWSVPWPQDAPPEDALVTDDGQRVVLLGNISTGYHGPAGGNGRDVVVLDERGKLLAAYRSDDLYMEGLDPYQEDFVPSFRRLHTIDGSAQLNREQSQAQFQTLAQKQEVTRIATVALRLSDGAQIEPNNEEQEALLEKERATNRKRLSTAEGYDLFSAIQMCGWLQDKQSVGQLRALLKRKSHKGERNLDIPVTAGTALAAILGTGAKPLLDEQLREDRDPKRWLPAYEAAGIFPDDKDLERVFISGKSRDRQRLLYDLRDKDKGRALVYARRRLNDPDADVRKAGVSVLDAAGSQLDVPLLERALSDPALTEQAVRALGSLNPPGVEKTLRKVSKSHNVQARWRANIELADRGDPTASTELLRWAKLFLSGDEKQFNQAPGSLDDAKRVGRILAKNHTPGALEAYRRAKYLYDMYFDLDLDIRGTLVAMGDKEYLPHLRTAAEGRVPKGYDLVGGWPREGNAIEWLGYLKDSQSVPLLQRKLHSGWSYVRKAAEKALHAIEHPSSAAETE